MQVSANVADTWYAVVGVRLKAAAVLSGAGDMRIHDISMIAESNDDFEWALIHNPTVTGTFTWGDKANSAMQIAIGNETDPGATVTGGHKIDGSMAKAEGAVIGPLDSLITLGSMIDGTPDELVYAVRPLSVNANIQGSLNWTEY